MNKEYKRVNHYKYLDKYFFVFLKNMGYDLGNFHGGIVGAHGDKCCGYKSQWEKAGIAFPHGVAMYLLSYLSPWSDETRETKEGWVDVGEWVIKNKDRFLPFLPPIDETDKDILSDF